MSKQKFRTLKFRHLYRADYSITLIHFLSMTPTAFTAYKKVRTDKELKKMGNMAVGAVLHPKGGGGRAARLQTPSPHEPKFKKRRFCRHDDIKGFTCFTLQPKSSTEIG
jgi:hypothetical protein